MALHPEDTTRTVRHLVREQDPDRYAATLFAPAAARPHLFALYAFNVELARVPQRVSEPGLGEIRLQWWREALKQVAVGEITGNPVADALGAAIRTGVLPLAGLEGLVDATQRDLSRMGEPDMTWLESHCKQTTGALFALAGAMLGPSGAKLDRAAAMAGIAYGLTSLLRALPAQIARGRLYLPLGEVRAAAAPDDSLAASLAALRTAARYRLEEAEDAVARLPRAQQTGFLPLALVKPYLSLLEANTQNALRVIVVLNPFYRLWRLATWRPQSVEPAGDRKEQSKP